MTKQSTIAAPDHGAGVPQQRLDRMAGRRGLPFITVEATSIEDDLRDLLLGSTVTIAVECLQHPAGARPLLPCEAGVWRHRPAVTGCEETIDCLQPIETLQPERHQGGGGVRIESTAQAQKLKLLPIAEIVVKIAIAVIVDSRGVVYRQRGHGVRCKRRWSLIEDNNAGIVLR